MHKIIDHIFYNSYKLPIVPLLGKKLKVYYEDPQITGQEMGVYIFSNFFFNFLVDTIQGILKLTFGSPRAFCLRFKRGPGK